MADTIIKVENLSKHYNLGTINSGTLYRDMQSWWARVRGKEDPNTQIGAWNADQLNQDNSFWALKDVSFEVKQGDVVGIIGRNGAGKSTLLKILSRVTGPTAGNIKIKGRVASLLEVGTGFHPELTGRENVYLNGTILGMRKSEIDKKFDEIVAFAEIEKFIDTPVKRYSSGMYVRLAFAVAAHLDPEILIVDEVLAVGDAEFQKKCLGKMGEVSKEGRTVLFVSHNMNAVKNLCNKCILFDKGKIIKMGISADVMASYLHQAEKNICTEKKFWPLTYQDGIAFSQVRLKYNGNEITNGCKLSIEVDLDIKVVNQFSVSMFFYKQGELLFVASDYHKTVMNYIKKAGTYRITYIIEPYLLNTGYYTVDFVIADFMGNQSQKISQKDVLNFFVTDDGYRRGEKYNLGWGGSISPILEMKTCLLENLKIQ